MTTDTNNSDLMRAALQETAAVLEMGDTFPGLLKMVKRALAAPAQPVAESMLYRAAINCPHEIDANTVCLHFDAKQRGKNALNQLADRLDAAAPTPPAQAQEHGGDPPTSEDALAAREFYESQEDSLLICASDLQHSAIYDNHIEMQSCIRAVASRIAALASVIEDMGCTPLATPMQDARQPLTEDQIGAAVRAAHIAFCLDKFQTFERALVHFTEQAHGIAAQQVKQP